MNRAFSLALLVVGVALLFWGFNASSSIASDVSKTVTGAPTDRSITLIVLGSIAAIIGGIGMVRRGTRS